MTRTRQFLILFVSMAAFAGMIALVAVGVSSRRRHNDLVFGLERLDVLIREGNLEEAASMVPWLSGRADDAAEVLSVLKRGYALYEAGAGPEPLHKAAGSAALRFPGNSRVRAIAVYAAVRAGSAAEALEISRENLGTYESLFFAWSVLHGGGQTALQEFDGAVSDGSGSNAAERGVHALFLARLDGSASAQDMERAWRLSGDWRYAADAAILFMKLGNVADASRVITGASVSMYSPMVAADIYTDSGETAAALLALSNAPDQDDPRIGLRIADALMALGRSSEAGAIYEALLGLDSSGSQIAHLNLAFLADDDETRALHYALAVSADPRFWPAVEQRGLYLAETDLAASYDSLADYTGEDLANRSTLLRLKLTPEMDAAYYEAAIWDTLSAEPDNSDALRYAAWYFAGRNQLDELSEVLRMSGAAAWSHTYRGLLAASTNDWSSAAAEFGSAYAQSPSWQSAVNLAIARWRTGSRDAAREMLEDAASRAAIAGYPPESVRVFVLIAETAEDQSRAFEAVSKALEIDPSDGRANLILTSLQAR